MTCDHQHWSYPYLVCVLPANHMGFCQCTPKKNPDHYQAGAFCEHDNDIGIVCADCVRVVPLPPNSVKRRDSEGFRVTAKGQRVRRSNGQYAR
jgi:hypothetical protein